MTCDVRQWHSAGKEVPCQIDAGQVRQLIENWRDGARQGVLPQVQGLQPGALSQLWRNGTTEPIGTQIQGLEVREHAQRRRDGSVKSQGWQSDADECFFHE